MDQKKFHIGSPVLSPYPNQSPMEFLQRALYQGTVTATPTEIRVESEEGMKVVFTGDFTLTGDTVTGGTMTGFVVYLGSAETLRAKNYEVDAAALYEAIEAYTGNSRPFNQLIVDGPSKFVGSKYGDLITDGGFEGKAFDDVLLGKKGDDLLISFTGDDTLKGGKGNDWLMSLSGNDKLFGGKGNDTFAFELYTMATETGVGKIKDFVKGEDVINISTDLPGFRIGPLKKKFFHKGTSAEGPDDHIIYDKASGKIFVDYDGSDAGTQIHFASVTPGTKLQSHDFMVSIGLL